MKPFTFKIGGVAGAGIMSAGLTFSKIASRSGFFVYDYTEYPSLIRGGHNVMQTTVGDESVNAAYLKTDFLVALNQETIDLHAGELSNDSFVLYNADQKINIEGLPKGARLFAVPFDGLIKEAGGSALMRNTVAIGASLACVGGDFKILKKIIAEEFESKKEDIIKQNQDVAKAGYDYILKNYTSQTTHLLKPRLARKKQIVVTGNDAVAMGAIAAGMQFAAIYPMTPTSNILHTLALHQEEYGYIYKQPEDEISAINMAIGASFAGARSMVATAGGGFCLMTEGYGLAGSTETPIVIIEGMRGSPATGLPTWTEQGDLQFVLRAHQGDFPRIVLAPGDVSETFYMTMQAFNLADIYQTPVVVLVDKHLCESHLGVLPFDYKKYKINRGKFSMDFVKDYMRYKLSKDGVSLRIPPGNDAHIMANSDEHNEEGYSTEDAEARKAQMEKRMRKLQTCSEKDMPSPVLYGPKNARLTIVSWGSTKGAILEALKYNASVNFLHLVWMNPFPTESVKKILGSAKKILNIETNYSAQCSNLIAEKIGIMIKNHLLKYDGRPIFPEEILAKIQQINDSDKK